jgi:hypothetical protein
MGSVTYYYSPHAAGEANQKWALISFCRQRAGKSATLAAGWKSLTLRIAIPGRPLVTQLAFAFAVDLLNLLAEHLHVRLDAAS